MSGEFTVKDIVTGIDKKLDKFIDKVEADMKDTDSRLDSLEQHKASVVSNFKLAAWMFGSIGGLGGLYALLKLIVQ